MPKTGEDLPAYSAPHFRDRDHEVNVILAKAERLLKGRREDKRTIVLTGLRGVGKSWLIHRIAEQVTKLGKCAVVLLNLGEAPESNPTDAAKALIQIAGDALRAQPGVSVISCSADADVSTVGSSLVEDIKSLLKARPLLLLLDHVDDCRPDLLGPLEENLVAPLALQEQVLVVMAGRNRDVRSGENQDWILPELRYKNVEVLEVLPFPAEWTRQLIQVYNPRALGSVDEIQEISGGIGGSIWVLAQFIAGEPPVWTDKPAAVAKCCDMLLCKVGDTELREAFEALCVLRAFDDDRMSPLLGIYHGDPAAWTPEKCAPIRMAMVRTRLTRWAKDRSGYVMDEGVRRILEWLLRESKAELWRQLHSAAYRLYEEWARLPGPAKQCWQDEAAHHAAELENAGVDQVSKGE